MKSEYYNIKFKVFEENHDIAMSVFQEYDFCGIEEGYDELIATFVDKVYDTIDIEVLKSELLSLAPETELISIEKIRDRNWNEEWESHVQPVFVSDRITITPTHKASEIETEIKIIIDPKMSFGTGHHTTTRLMCLLMQDLVEPNSSWIDVGTGTGVLAILAAKLGASEVYGFDNNEWSIDNAIENVEKNGYKDKIRISLDDIDNMELYNCDGIAANIFLNLALPSIPKFKKAIGNKNGDILISGIMIYDESVLLNEALKNGLKLINSINEDEWVAFHFKIGDTN